MAASDDVISVAINELYRARNSECEYSTKQTDYPSFCFQLAGGFSHGILDLNETHVGNGILARLPKVLRRFHRILAVKLYGNVIRDEGIPRLHQLVLLYPSITRLDLGCNDLSDQSAVSIANLISSTRIQSLQLGKKDRQYNGNWITHSGLILIMNAVANSQYLLCFGIAGIAAIKQKKTQSGSQYPFCLANMIACCKNLSTLDISDSAIRSSFQYSLAQGFQRAINIRHLNLSLNPLGSDSDIAHGLITLKMLRYLNLSSCKLSASSCSVLAEGLNRGWNLISLNLSSNPIGSSAIGDLLLTLCKNATLVQLNIAETNIDSSIGSRLAQLLKSTEVLDSLDLSRNRLEQTKVFGEVLGQQSTLRSLSLNSCKITDAGAIEIATAVAQNKVLRKLNLGDNFLTNSTGFEIVQILTKNDSLVSLDLSSNQIDCFALKAAESLCCRNKTSERERTLSGFRSRTIQLSIQASKIPGIMANLGEVEGKTASVNDEIGKVSGQIETAENGSMETIRALKKSINELEQLIEADRAVIIQTETRMTEIRETTEKAVSELKKKAGDEERTAAAYELKAAENEEKKENVLKRAEIEKAELAREINDLEAKVSKVQEVMADKAQLKTFQFDSLVQSNVK